MMSLSIEISPYEGAFIPFSSIQFISYFISKFSDAIMILSEISAKVTVVSLLQNIHYCFKDLQSRLRIMTAYINSTSSVLSN